MSDYLSWDYENGRIFDAMPVEQVAYALSEVVRSYTGELLFVRDFTFTELANKTAQESRCIGDEFSELELYLDEVAPKIAEGTAESRSKVNAELTQEFLRRQAELRKLLRVERAKITPLKLLLQEHFIMVAAVVWDGIVGNSTRKNVSFIEEPFCDLARARDELFDEWSSKNFREYLKATDKLMAMKSYDNWRFHAEREFYDADHEFPTLDEIQAVRDELEVEELWRARN